MVLMDSTCFGHKRETKTFINTSQYDVVWAPLFTLFYEFHSSPNSIKIKFPVLCVDFREAKKKSERRPYSSS